MIAPPRAMFFDMRPEPLDLLRISSLSVFAAGTGRLAMNARKQGTQLRRIVAQRLDTFFAAWLEQLGAGTTALWQRVEGRAERSAPSDDAPHEDAPGVMHVPMQQQAPQQQAMQQQQQKKKE